MNKKYVEEKADTINNAGGRAYSLTAKQTLAQYCVTGCFNNTYYSSGAEQLNVVAELVKTIEPEFVAKVAIYARKYGYMKDMPAYLLALMCANNFDKKLFVDTFNKV